MGGQVDFCLDIIEKNIGKRSKKRWKRKEIWNNRKEILRKDPKRGEKEEEFGAKRRNSGEKVQKVEGKRRDLEQ